MKTNVSSKNGFALPIVIAIAVVLAISGGAYYFNVLNLVAPTSQPEDAKAERAGVAQEDGLSDVMADKDENAMVKEADDAAMEKEEDAMTKKPSEALRFDGMVLAGTRAPLLDFQKSDYDKAVVSGKLVLLYFYADWCPICKAEFPKMQAAFNGLATDQVTGFRVNYKDNFTDADEVALAKQFGVAYQHTKVFVKGGSQLSKHPDSWDEVRYAKEINDRL